MHRYAFLAGALFVLGAIMPPSAPALAITAKQKMETCKFGADHPNGGAPALAGKERKHFIERCMSNKNDPRGTPNG
jgi:hypothetical protein